MCAWGKPKVSSFTTKLSHMVGDLKPKCKALAKCKAFAADHALLLDLLAAPPSLAFAPLFPFLSSHIPSQSPPPLHFTSHTSPSTSLTPSPLRPATYSTPSTVHSPPMHIHASHSTPITPRESPPSITPHIVEKKSSSDKKSLHRIPSPLLSPPAAPHGHHGKYSAQGTLGVAALLALLCTFVCVGKEMAFVVAVAAHLILWLALRLGLLARGKNAVTINSTVLDSFHQEDHDNSVKEDNRETENGRTQTLRRSSRHYGATFSTPLQWTRRTKSWTKLHSSVQQEGKPGDADEFVDFPSSDCVKSSLSRRGKASAKLKLQTVLLFTLCGLFHGRILAVCMAICCILIYSTMESLFLKRLS